MKKIILEIEGMTCSACSNGLERYLKKQKGIQTVSVNLVMANASVEYDETILEQKQIEEFIKEAGFESKGLFKEIKIEEKSKKEKVKFFIFLGLAVLLMYISMGHMVGLPIWHILDMHKNPIPYTMVLFLLTSSFVLYGFDILKNGYKNLIHKTPNMDTLVSIGVLSGLGYSIYSMVRIMKGEVSYVENLYFESSAIIIFFLKLGRYIDGISKDKTKEALQKLVKITPSEATIKKDGKERKVTLDEIQKEDILISRAGEKIAVDGEIVLGKAHLDESFLTGESKPVSKKVGEKVLAGSINYDGYLEYKAERIGKESTISEIVKLVMEASNTKAPIAKIADTVSGYFVPIVILIAIVAFLGYLLLGHSIATAMNVLVSVLVVACPCSLGLATPLAIVVSEGLCAENGILVKKSEILENAQKINTMVFDKTGTLTYGTLKIAHIIKKEEQEETKLLQLVGSIEKQGTHPIAKAFVNELEERQIPLLPVEDYKEISGYGVKGKIEEIEILLGNAKMLAKYEIENPYEEEEKNLSKQGNSIVYVVANQKVIALIGVNDKIRENAKEVIEILNKNKIETIMLTGDNKQSAEKIAKEIGINNVIANVVPAEKVKVIERLKKENKFVMMCGDGINDSPALAGADIGVSVNSGTDIAMDSSDVILTRNDLYCIINLIHISKKTIRNIKQNLFWAFFYNVLMIPIAIGFLKPMGIEINPMIASMAMVISSFTVILNALRLRRIKVK